MQFPPGVFDQTGGDLHLNGAHFGLCWVIFREQGLSRARIGRVVKSEKGCLGEWLYVVFTSDRDLQNGLALVCHVRE